MDAEGLIQSAETVIQQMTDNPEEILVALNPAERVILLEELGYFSTRVADVNSWAELIEIADDICRLVENNPTLRPLFFDALYDVPQAQIRRKVSLVDQKTITATGQYTQARAVQIKNSVLECRDQLRKALGELGLDALETTDKEDDRTHGSR